MTRAAIAILVFAVLPAAAADRVPYADYAAVLDAHVDEDGLVDYAALAANRAPLDRFVETIAALDRAGFAAWDAEARLAFWLNAYNALTLRLIIDNYETALSAEGAGQPRGIRRIEGAWTDIRFRVLGEEMTLDHIEHGVIRKRFPDPRVHMALVCAAVSCPELRSEPYRGPALDAQLDDQTRDFLSKPSNFRADRGAGVVWLSSIFDWFAGDFGGAPSAGAEEGVMGFVLRYVSEDTRDFLLDGRYEIRHIDYDWTLNDSGL